MEKEKLAKLKLVDAPGVYFFLGARKEILYIGKATSLKNRVRSYFTDDIIDKRSPLIEQMVAEAKTISATVTDSVLEALILETNLIRTHKPKYNSRSKDDKSYNHLVITNEVWPRVLVIREKDITENYTSSEIKYDFGPFTSGSLFREALKIVRKLFQFYDTKEPVGAKISKLASGKIDFNRQIGLYPDIQSKAKYNRTIRHIKLFFEGKKNIIIHELEREMSRLAKQEKFEEAHIIKRKIFALNHIQDVALIKSEHKVFRDDKTIRIEAFDIAHLDGEDMVGSMTVVEGGEARKSEYRKFKIRTLIDANDPAALREILDRRLGHPEWPSPQIIVVDGSTAQKNVAERVVRQRGLVIPVVAVVKDDHHKASRLIGPKNILENHKLDILYANAESHRFAINFFRKIQRQRALRGVK
ncbi:GIY-YIG nuclease family protein [Candidatus Kaiserbacteria bacterium]|nr:GIY-YIG nuclease family protein [Candidatus Kaiserbacteria bacterium]